MPEKNKKTQEPKYSSINDLGTQQTELGTLTEALEEGNKRNYPAMVSGQATRTLMSIDTKSIDKDIRDTIKNVGKENKVKENHIQTIPVVISTYRGIPVRFNFKGLVDFSNNEKKVFILALIELCKHRPHRNQNPTLNEIERVRHIDINLLDIMEKCNIKNETQARDIAKSFGESLLYASIDYEDNSDVNITLDGKRTKKPVKQIEGGMNYIESWEYENRTLSISFSIKFLQSIIFRGGIKPAPEMLLYLKKRYSLPIWEELSNHYQIRVGKKGYEKSLNTIGVETLFNNTPLHKVEIKNSRYKQLIIDPFEEALEELVDLGILKEWFYTGSNGKKLTSKQLAGMKYNQWKQLYLHFEWIEELKQDFYLKSENYNTADIEAVTNKKS